MNEHIRTLEDWCSVLVCTLYYSSGDSNKPYSGEASAVVEI